MSYVILLIILYLFCCSNGEDEKLETYCSIHAKRPLQYVSDKFLSISIDPAALLAGLNLSDSSLLLAKHLGPAYIRIAGPSTKFVKYVDNEDKSGDRLSEDGNSVVVTPSMWFGINEWLSLANLTPVFGINDVETTEGVWNPKSALPLLEISDKLNVTCYWQLGFDASQKSEMQYKQDLNMLYDVISAFPERNDSWKIVGSDISNLPKNDIGNTLDELKGIVTAVMWEPRELTFPEKHIEWKQHKQAAKIWTTIPKSSEPILFSSALLWAMQIGEAAKLGYEVVFRQPRLFELFSDTSIYWVSLLHKKLMGSNVLDTKITAYHSGSSVYTHCTRKQNGLDKRGALTLMIVNSNLQPYKVKVKLGSMSVEESMEVQYYILTSSAENSTDIFLNGKKLTLDRLLEKNLLEPQQVRAKLKPHLSIEVPPLSISFFVLMDASVPFCINDEDETDCFFEESVENQKLPFSEEVNLNLASRGSFLKSPTLEAGDKTYSKGKKNFIDSSRLAENQKKDIDLERRREELKKFLFEDSKTVDKHESRLESKSKNLELTSEEIENILKGRAKARAAERDIFFTDEELNALIQKENRKFSRSKFKRSPPSENAMQRRDINKQLLERQINLDSSTYDSKEEFSDNTSEEYHIKVFNITDDDSSYNNNDKLIRKPRDINMKLLDIRSKLAEGMQRIEDKKYEILGNTETIKQNIKDRIKNLKYKNRFKRDINMELLKLKTEGQRDGVEKKQVKNLFKDKDRKATIRKPGQTSEELLKELEEEEESIKEKQVVPKIDVYAELAVPEDIEESIEFLNINPKPKKLNILDKISKIIPSVTENPRRGIVPGFKKTKTEEKSVLTDDIKFLTSSDEFTDVEEYLPCIHEYFGSDTSNFNGAKDKESTFELGELVSLGKTFKKGSTVKRKTAEIEDTVMSSEQDLVEILRKKRDTANFFGEPIQVWRDSSVVPKFEYVDEFLAKLENVTHELNELTILLSNNENKLIENFESGEQKPLEDETGEKKDKLADIMYAGNQEEFTGDKRRKRDTPAILRDIPANKDCTKIEMIETKGDFCDVRHKRGSDQKANMEEEKIYDVKKDLQVLKNDAKQHLKELQHLMTNDKLKYEEEKMNNKLKVLHLKKNEEDPSIQEKGEVLGEIHKTEKEKRSEIKEQLQLLKKTLTHRKKEIDKLLLKDVKLHEKLGEEKQGNLKDMLVKEKQKLIEMKERFKLGSAEPKEVLQKDTKVQLTKVDANEATGEHDVEHKGMKTLPRVHLTKRSVVDRYYDDFGNYKSLTTALKSWEPSDIVSLKRDANLLNSQKLKPTSDVYRNKFGQDKYFSFRGRRSINSNDLENEIDGNINGIEKDGEYVRPKIEIKKSEYFTENFGNQYEVAKNDKRDTGFVNNASTCHTFNGTKNESGMDLVVENNRAPRISNNTQNSTASEEQAIFKSFIGTLTEFFRTVTKKIGCYVKNITDF